MPEPGRCRSCHAPVLWVTMAKTLKSAPLDPKPVNVPDGDADRLLVTLDENGQGLTVRGRSGYVSHFGTCPNAGQHRRRGK